MGNRSTWADVVAGWDAGGGPRFRRLARTLAGAIDRGALAPGSRLPSERALAQRLGVSRGLVVSAFDALLADDLVERRHGSGTYVRRGVASLPADREGTALVRRLVERSADEDAGPRPIDLSLSVVHDLDDLAIPRLDGAALRRVEPETGYSPWGLRELRAAIAAHVTSWGLPSDPDQIVVTTGAQQAIAACAACWVRPGDVVVLDAPTYPGAVAAFRQAGARLVGVPVDRDGIMVTPLEAALRERRPTLVYLQSGVHSPTGTVLSERRRREIARLLARHRVPLVEDAALVDTAWEPIPPPLAVHGPDLPVAVVGSLSKLFWGGLRIGFVRAPSTLAPRFARVKATLDLGSSAPSQVLAHRLLTAPGFATFLDARRALLRERADALMQALRTSRPDWTFEPPRGGLSLWVRTHDGDAAARAAEDRGVIVGAPGPLLPDTASERRSGDHIRLSFSGPVVELVDAAGRLA